MMKRRLFLVLMLILTMGIVSSASAATTLKQLALNPFYRHGVSSAADLQNLVKDRTVDLQTGFALAGEPDLYPVFMKQFPTAIIVPVKISPGDKLTWMLFKKKKNGKVAILKDVSWKGAKPFNAYGFTIDKDGKRYEFLVPALCGNISLKNVAQIPPPPAPAPVAAPAPVPPPPPPAPVAAPVPPPPAPARVAVPPPPPVAPAPKMAAAPPPVAPAPAPAAAPDPPPVAKLRGGLLADFGWSHMSDPADYVFARAGYEMPLVDKLYLMGLVGGYLRVKGPDGGTAFTADVMLDYHWLGRASFGLGAGYWSGNGGQIDLLANLGLRIFGEPDGRNGSIFLEARLPSDDLGNSDKFGRYGLGLRLRF